MTYWSPIGALPCCAFHAVDAVDDLALDEKPKKPADAVGRLVTLSDGTRLEIAVSENDAMHLDALAQPRNRSIETN